MKILCLFVRYGVTRHPEALGALDRWYTSHGLIGQRTLWIIDNELPEDTPPRVVAPNVILRASDNRGWEFTAWERALREIEGEGAGYDVIHFVTSAFNTLYTRYLEHFYVGMLEYVTARNVCLGHIDSTDRPVEIDGCMSDSWIRTCFFFLPPGVARRVQPWAPHTDPARFYANPATTRFRDDAPLSASYQKRIWAWLKGLDVGGHTWHSPIGSSAEDVRRFQRKTLAILNEHSFTIALRAMGVQPVDFCWLHTLWKTPVSSVENPPPERDQLKVRRRILGIPEPAG